MAKKLEGTEFRVFSSLVHEWPRNTPDEIRVELTRGPEVSLEEVEAALSSLKERGYVEEKPPGHWQLAPNGYGVRRSLLGKIPDGGE